MHGSSAWDEPTAPPDLTTSRRSWQEATRTNSPLWLVLIGHGTFDGQTAKFNLRGPDLSADDLAEWLKPLNRPLAVIDCSSERSVPERAVGPKRVVITATKSGFEQNYARFGDYLAAAIVDPQADLDKDGQTSLLEAFLIASGAVDAVLLSRGPAGDRARPARRQRRRAGHPRRVVPRHPPRAEGQGRAALDGYRTHQLHSAQQSHRGRRRRNRAKRDQLELQVMDLRDNREKLPKTSTSPNWNPSSAKSPKSTSRPIPRHPSDPPNNPSAQDVRP